MLKKLMQLSNSISHKIAKKQFNGSYRQFVIINCALQIALSLNKQHLVIKMNSVPTSQQKSNPTVRARPSRVTTPKAVPISKERLRELIRAKLNKRKPNRREPENEEESEVNAQKSLTLKQVRESVDLSKLDCPICIELAVSPIMLTCGHVCCLKCFEESSLFSPRCPLCRQDQGLEDPHRSALAQTIIQEIILPKSPQYLEYLCREGEFLNWEKQRVVPKSQIKKEEVVDFKDDKGTWRRGCVKEVVYQDDQEPMVVMNYKINGEINTAEIPLNSRRFAKKGFFTISKYFIERSNPIRTEIEADSLLNPEIAPIPSEFTAEQLLEIPSINPNFANQQEMEIEEDSSHHFPNQENLDLNMQLLAHDMQDGDNMLPFI